MSQPNQEGDLALVSRALGGLPIINHVLDRLGLPALLAGVLPAGDARVKLDPAAAVRLVVTNLVLGREPLYGLGEWAARYDPGLLGLTATEVDGLNDDRVGRALEALFDADRASLLTAVVLRAVSEFAVDTTQLHNDSTSISVHGAYRGAGGAVPLAYRLADGNTSDDPTHIPTWDGLVALLVRGVFLYVADSKLCSRAAMGHIAGSGGRFITVLPRSRAEDATFRDWLQTHTPNWTRPPRRTRR